MIQENLHYTSIKDHDLTIYCATTTHWKLIKLLLVIHLLSFISKSSDQIPTNISSYNRIIKSYLTSTLRNARVLKSKNNIWTTHLELTLHIISEWI